MNRPYPHLIAIGVLCIFLGCDCQYEVKGFVLDARTLSPISNVSIGKTDTVGLDNPFNRKSFTNSDGTFDIMGIAGGCDDITLFFMHPDYITHKTTLATFGIDTIYLEKK